MGRFISGMTAGALVGAALGTVILSQMDRRTQRMIRKAGKRMMSTMGDTYDDMMHWMR
ncbi:YtxH domain-containing protein [Clostridium polynesiense]|uniref:YtxH domain-containing protein n=1 Tax=Clostridium polynesiense TaxID=1325933 RepID=UPI000B092CD2|nr:YtxH domain-containing protein [Clostridium polynesiense]